PGAAVRRCRAAARGHGPAAGLARGRGLPRRVDQGLLGAEPAGAPARVVGRRRDPRRRGPAPEPRRRGRHVGDEGLSTQTRPAFYALATGGWRDYVPLLPP